MRPSAVATILFVVVAACGRSMVGPPCRLGDEHELASIAAPSIDQLEVVATRHGALVVWSSRDGTWARPLDARARPSGEARRVGPPAPGGLALSAARRDGRERIGALLVEPGGASGRYGAARLLELDGAGAVIGPSITVGPAGARAEGAAIVATSAGYRTAWNDGAQVAPRVRIAEVRGGEVVPRDGRALSTPGRSAGAPVLLEEGEDFVAVWQETWLGARGRQEGTLRALSAGRARDVRTVARPSAGPSLVRFADRWVISYRDNRDGPRDRHAEYYVGPLFGPSGADHRISRANGPRAPRLVACGPVLIGVALRSFARDVLVGVNRVGESLEKLGGELQVYQDRQTFSHATAVCRRPHPDAAELVLVYGEQGSPRRPGRRVVSAAMRCPP